MDSKPKYHRIEDDFSFYVKGFTEYYDTNKDGMKFAVQLRNIHDLFYMDSEKVEEHFVIRHRSNAVSALLNEYFISGHSRFYSDRIYGNQLNLIDMFASTMEYSAIFGDVYYFIDWQTKKYNDKEYVLPDSFDYISPETMRTIKKGAEVEEYIQKYSLYERIRQRMANNKINTIHFEPWKIFHLSYPLSQKPPVQESFSLLKPLLNFTDFMLSSGEAGAYRKPRSLAVERTRNKSFSQEQRNYNLIKARVIRDFRLPIGVDGLELTKYYDFSSVTRYKSEQYKARKYYVDMFNEQILKPFAEKNNLKQPPRLEMVGLLTEDECQSIFNQWEKSEISDEDFINKLAKAD